MTRRVGDTFRGVTGRSHAIIGAATGLALLPELLETANGRAPSSGELIAGTIVCAGAALLPDLDHPQATAARVLGPVSEIASRLITSLLGGHRAGTHSLAVAGLTAVLLAGLLGRGGLTATITALVVAALMSAMALRVVTGAPWLVVLLLAGAAASAVVVACAGDYTWLPASVLISMLAHDACDLSTTEGIALFWPLSRRKISLPLVGHTGGLRERLVAGVASIVACWLWVSTVVLPALAG